MKLARVTGSVHATVKDAALTGTKLLLCREHGGQAFVAADTVGAGAGDTVLIATGSAARMPQVTAGAPHDAAIVAIVDRVDNTNRKTKE
ncbi:MAG: EutN/CcmL family microcompartment protein [Rhodobacteraceae bacterium]|nr:EutN/CcmL family microcompartment protein [Paracoccaceae bacterium]